jgi:hypothetical protein
MLICRNNTKGDFKIHTLDGRHVVMPTGEAIRLSDVWSYRDILESPDLSEIVKGQKMLLSLDGVAQTWEEASKTIRQYAEQPTKDIQGNLLIKNKPFADDDGFRKRVKGYKATFNTKGVSEHTWDIAEERWMEGLELIVKGHKTGDAVQLITIDKIGVYAGKYYPIGTPLPFVLDQFGDDYFLSEEIQKQGQVTSNFLGRLLPGMALRMVYTGKAETNVENGIELYLNLFTNIKVPKPS